MAQGWLLKTDEPVTFDDQQRTLAWNHECERMTGYQVQEMIGKPDAYQLLFGVGSKADGTALGKRPVQERPIACKDRSVRHVAWLFMSRELTLPGWSQCGLASSDRSSPGGRTGPGVV